MTLAEQLDTRPRVVSWRGATPGQVAWRREAVARLHGEGHSAAQIARLVGASRKAVSNDMHQLGITPAGTAGVRGGWVGSGPLVTALRARGPLSVLGPTRARAVHRAARSGRVTRAMADELCTDVLGEHPAAVYGPSWWDDTDQRAGGGA